MKGSRLSGWLTLAVFATVGGVIAADPAFAKVDVDKFTIGGEARIRYEYRTNAGFSTTTNANESAASHRVRVNVGYDLTPDVSFFAQLQDARIWGSEGNAGGTTSGIGAVSSANQGNTGVDLHQGYILLKNVLVSGLSVKAGRQEPLLRRLKLLVKPGPRRAAALTARLADWMRPLRGPGSLAPYPAGLLRPMTYISMHGLEPSGPATPWMRSP